MKILLVSATWLEVEPLIIHLKNMGGLRQTGQSYKWNNIEFNLLITGVGIAATAYSMAKALHHNHQYQLVIDIGIAGAFRRKGCLTIGEVVYVETDCFAELGVRGNQGIQTIFDIGLVKPYDYPYNNGLLVNTTDKLPEIVCRFLRKLPSVKAITSDTIHANPNEIEQLAQMYKPYLETMEGAAFYYVTLNDRIPAFQLRAISNYVEERDVSKWEIPWALNNLGERIFMLFNNLNKEIARI